MAPATMRWYETRRPLATRGCLTFPASQEHALPNTSAVPRECVCNAHSQHSVGMTDNRAQQQCASHTRAHRSLLCLCLSMPISTLTCT
eukprot:3152233-Alexandrium_andersonii.AAC.1